MRFLVQRVKEADVSVDGKKIAGIGQGFLVLVGISGADIESGNAEKTADKMVKKLVGLRIFRDAQGKTNLNLKSVGGQLLMISQFTIYADCRKGNRPSFTDAAPPEAAEALYQYILEKCRQEMTDSACSVEESASAVKAGIFGADMKVSLINDGPFTVMLDSDSIPVP